MATTTATTTSGSTAVAGPPARLTAKDIVLLAVFGVVTFFVMMVGGHGVQLQHRHGLVDPRHRLHPGRHGVRPTSWRGCPSAGRLFIAGAIMALLGFVMGMAWTGPGGHARRRGALRA